MWLPLNSTNECVIIINHQTFKFLIPQHTVTRIFISSEDALSLLLLFVSPSFLSPSPVCCCVLTFCIVPRRRRGMRGSLTTGSPTSLGGLPPPCLMQASQTSWCGSRFATVLHHTCRGRGSLPAFPSSPTSFPCPLRWLSQRLVLYKAHAGRTGLRKAGTERDALREAREVSLLRLLPGKLSLFLSIHLIPVCKLFTLFSPTCPCSHPSQTTKKVPCSKALSPT